MKKILLINPAFKGSLHSNIKVLALPPLNLAIIARYTPEHYEVQIVDEAMEELDPDIKADLVGITCMTPLAPRAYELAAQFRARGIPVVMGGIHVSYMTDEALQYADTIVVGEGENIWPKVLEDFERGQMQRVYRACEPPEVENMLAPRRDLLKGKYFVETVQTGRGCPINCNFCSVTAFNGSRYRVRNIDSVIDEINSIKSKRIFIVDDNIVGQGPRYIRRAKELFDRMADCNKEWGGQTCLSIVEHDDVLKAAQRSGCKGMLIGFESLDPATIDSMHKSVNLRPNTRNFRDAIKKLHDHGIAIVGCFIFGTEGQTRDAFRRAIDFVLENEIDAVQLSLETPLPGTAFYKQMQEEGRLLLTDYPNDWRHYTIFEPVFRMNGMTPVDAYEGLLEAYAEVSSFGSSIVRGVKTFRNTRSLFSTGISFSWNYQAYKTIRNTRTPLVEREKSPVRT
ncbi:MAG: B12-binding domain-containing radical SAM protein [Gammaproteobacteria bacterium]|nr:B12-binding domain-containing radical SAM protein [Gammaproteobacteria bacterium]MBU1968994.1 B12-binding domain-containing radical SAM protein [Gammaproteobacteria bacterium]